MSTNDTTGTPGQPASSHRLWGGRFGAQTAAALDAVNKSIGVDYRLWPHDVKLSQSWARALQVAGVLTAAERDAIVTGLDEVARRLAAGAQPDPSDEDVHTMVDRMLHGIVGDPAAKLHTGRSRNDQVATGARMWVMEACRTVDQAVRDLQQVLLEQADGLVNDIMPAYTHLQRAQPVSAAHWVLAHFWAIQRDRERLAHVAQTTATLPLGSGAIAGCAFPVPRDLLRDELGFARLSANSIDAVADRDFIVEMLFALAMLGSHVSRIAEDFILFGTSEFGFVKFGDTFTTGSSMMPQKRNPDALEIARGSGGRFLGELVSLLATLKGLPSGYNKDLQDDKRALFASVDAMLLVLPGVAGTLAELTWQRDRMRAAVSSVMMATDLADYLVDRGVTFRESHKAVGAIVREAEVSGRELHTLPLAAYAAAHPTFGEDVMDALSAEASVRRRDVPGGTGPNSVARQLSEARAALLR
ncbi:MAG: argininosuccinate lyase [Gemmatimonadetes bacterium]|nr:argininosuccinate lyase [Gemmatimonadota bacterium]